MVQIFGTAKFPYNIMRTGCVAKERTQCQLSKTIPNVAHYSSELNCGHLGWPRSISFTWNASNNSAFRIVQLIYWIGVYMNKLAHVRESFWTKNTCNHFCSLLVCKLLTTFTFVGVPVWWGRAAGVAGRRQATGLQGSPVSAAGAASSWSRPTPLCPAHYFQP